VYNRGGNDDVMFVQSAPILHGVALFPMATSDRCCAPSFFPSVYAAVARHAPWVRAVVANATATDGAFTGCHAQAYGLIMGVLGTDGVGVAGTCPPTWPFYAAVLAAACGNNGGRRTTIAAVRDAWVAWTVCNCPMMSTWYAGNLVKARTDLAPDVRMECLYSKVYPAMYDLRARRCSVANNIAANITGLKSLKAYVDTLLVLGCQL
jgi:hypothetical protein